VEENHPRMRWRLIVRGSKQEYALSESRVRWKVKQALRRVVAVYVQLTVLSNEDVSILGKC